jgi:hypothetical protein
MAIRLSALRAGRPLPPGKFLVLISFSGWVDPRAIVRLQGLGQLKYPMTSSGLEPATFQILALVPQPTTLPRAPHLQSALTKYKQNNTWLYLSVFLNCWLTSLEQIRVCNKWIPWSKRLLKSKNAFRYIYIYIYIYISLSAEYEVAMFSRFLQT